MGRSVNVDVDGGGQGRKTLRCLRAQPIPSRAAAPQVIVVQQPPVTRIVEVQVPAPEPRVEPPPRPAEPPPPPYVPTGDRTVYVIPGCYVGNVSPVNVKLPPNCDITKVTTYVP